MSSENSNIRILDAALALIKRRKGADVSMAEIAKAARVSRQAVYLHFADRADLMLALVRYAHEKLGVAEQVIKLEQAANGVAAMKLWVSLQARITPEVATELLWSVTSLRAWEELVLERGWTASQYEQHITTLLCDALVKDAK